MDYGRLLFYERNMHSVTANTREDGCELLAEAAQTPLPCVHLRPARRQSRPARHQSGPHQRKRSALRTVTGVPYVLPQGLNVNNGMASEIPVRMCIMT